MALPGDWIRNQANRITFVMVDGTGNEVAGIGDGNLTVEVAKNAGAFVGGAGTDTEMSDGWYSYISTVAEADTIGTVSVKVDGAGAIQQNLEYIIEQRTPNAVEFTYTVTDSGTGLPIPGFEVWVTTDLAGDNTIWRGTTDAFGVARDVNGNLPLLDPGTYYFWKQLAGYSDDDNPDTETVS